MSFFKDFKNDLSQAVGGSEEQLNVEGVSEIPVSDISDNDISLQNDLNLDNLFKSEADTVVSDDILQAVTQAQIDLEDNLDSITVETENLGEVNLTPVMETEIPAVEEVVREEPEAVVTDFSSIAEDTVSVLEENNTVKEEVNTMSEIDNNFENEPATDESAIITEGMRVTGDIISTGNMDVLGTIKGNVDIKGKLTITGVIEGNSKAAEIFADSAKITGNVVSSGSVKVGQSSVIVGDIMATSAVVAGAVKGNIDVHGPVILDTSAIVMGDIKSKSVQINNGAVIEGHCSQCYAEVSPTSFFNDIK